MADPDVVLVLDDATLSKMLAEHLREMGFNASSVASSAAALELCSATPPAAVVASQLLPGLDGVKLTQRLKETAPIPMILIAGGSSLSMLQDLRRLSGANVVLPRSFKPEALLAALRDVTMTDEARKAKRAAAASARKPTLTPTPTPVPVPTPTPVVVAAPPAASIPAPAPFPSPSPRPVTPVLEPAALLSRAFLDRVTGALRFTRESVERIVYLEAGRPLFVTSNVAEERLGAVLIRKEKITETELEEAINYGQKKKVRLLQVLVDMGVLTEKEKIEEVAEHYAERILALFAWSDGAVQFRIEAVPAEEIPIALPPERLVLEGLRRHYDAARLQSLLDPNQALRPGPELAAGVAAMHATSAEAAVLQRLDGVRSLVEACRLAGESPEAPQFDDSLRMLYACLCLGLMT